MMNRIKELKYFTLVMLLCSFVAAGSLSSCWEQKKQENAEQQGEHPENEEHPTEEGSVKEEHPAKEGEEHPKKEGEEHQEGEEHPKDSVSA